MPASPAQNHNPNFLDFVPRARVLIYEGTTNIGDAIQTVAIARLLGGVCAGVYRDSPIPRLHDDVPFVVNGWLGRGTPVNGANCIFAGVHLGHREPGYIRWIRESTNPVGARDEYTKGLLASNGIPSEMVACATLTFPRYLGPRRGRYSVDVEPVPGSAFESSIIANLPWAEQWELALHRLDQLRKAELVYTRRLHVILPCLAFGTPVVFPSNEFRDLFDKSRLGLLHDIGFVYDEAVEMDVAPLADRFVRFLENALNTSLNPVDHPSMPIPITPRDSGEHDGLPSAGQLTAVREGCAPPAAVELSARSGRAQPMVSAVVLTKNGAGRIERCLESIAASGLASEIVVCVDRSTTDATMSIAGRYTQHVHLLETRGFIEPSLPEMVSLCSGQFILRLDDDECLGGEWGGLWLQALSRFNDLTHFLTPCRWVVPPGDRFIASPPWFPDFRVRVFRNKPALISWPDQIHDKMTIAGRGLALVDRWIDHYVLVDRSRSEREAKCRYYQSLRPAKHLSHCYLWEDQEVILSSTDDRGYAAAVERALPAQTPAQSAATPAGAPSARPPSESSNPRSSHTTAPARLAASMSPASPPPPR